jgi:hypothetical protein
LDDWRTDREVALVQARVLAGVQALRQARGADAGDDDAAERADVLLRAELALQYERHDLNALYFEFARPLRLHSACLAVLAFAAQPAAQGRVREHWRDLVDDAVADCLAGDRSGRVVPVPAATRAAVVAHLTRSVGGAAAALATPRAAVAPARPAEFDPAPLPLLVSLLESVAVRLGFADAPVPPFDAGWAAVGVLDAVGAPMPSRFAAYESVVRDAVSRGDEVAQLGLVHATAALLRAWLERAGQPGADPARVRELATAAHGVADFVVQECKAALRSLLPRGGFGGDDGGVGGRARDADALAHELDGLVAALRHFQQRGARSFRG